MQQSQEVSALETWSNLDYFQKCRPVEQKPVPVVVALVVVLTVVVTVLVTVVVVRVVSLEISGNFFRKISGNLFLIFRKFPENCWNDFTGNFLPLQTFQNCAFAYNDAFERLLKHT